MACVMVLLTDVQVCHGHGRGQRSRELVSIGVDAAETGSVY